MSRRDAPQSLVFRNNEIKRGGKFGLCGGNALSEANRFVATVGPFRRIIPTKARFYPLGFAEYFDVTCERNNWLYPRRHRASKIRWRKVVERVLSVVLTRTGQPLDAGAEWILRKSMKIVRYSRRTVRLSYLIIVISDSTIATWIFVTFVRKVNIYLQTCVKFSCKSYNIHLIRCNKNRW